MIARLYLRVSTDEQVKYGFSLDAQLEELKEYCKTNNYSIAGIYKDEGISASTITKRKEFVRMLEEVKPGEIILFTKLDRFSRNLLDANLVIKDLEKKKVSIKAINEDDIDTTTADGKFMFNIRLSIAEREREKTGERIKDVFKYKVSKGEVITGSPIGYKIENKKLVVDPDKRDIVVDIFNTYEKHNSIHKTLLYIQKNYNYTMTMQMVKKTLTNELYTGKYRNNLEYCEPIISKVQFEKIQNIIKNKNLKAHQTNSIYLFSGLIVDTNCGCKMSGCRGRTFPYYRCAKYVNTNTCKCNKTISERYLERYLLSQIESELDKYDKMLLKRYKIKTKKINTSAIKKELDRLNILFQKGRISEEYYDTEYLKLEKELKIDPPKKQPINLPTNWRDVYNNLSKEGKRSFWRSFIDRIEVNPLTKSIEIIFL